MPSPTKRTWCLTSLPSIPTTPVSKCSSNGRCCPTPLTKASTSTPLSDLPPSKTKITLTTGVLSWVPSPGSKVSWCAFGSSSRAPSAEYGLMKSEWGSVLLPRTLTFLWNPRFRASEVIAHTISSRHTIRLLGKRRDASTLFHRPPSIATPYLPRGFSTASSGCAARLVSSNACRAALTHSFFTRTPRCVRKDARRMSCWGRGTARSAAPSPWTGPASLTGIAARSTACDRVTRLTGTSRSDA